MEIRLENFGVYQGVHNINMDTPISIVIGKNRAGKTTIADAIRFVLSGKFNSKKKENVNIIHNGAKYAEVEIVFDDGFEIKRKVTQAGNESLYVKDVTDDTPESVKQTVIWNYLNTTEDKFSLFSKVNFLDMDKDGMKKFLGEYLQLSLDKDIVVERVKKEIGDNVGTVKDEINEAIGISVKEGIKKAEDYCVNMRRVLKRAKETLKPLSIVDFIEISGNKVELKSLNIPDIEKKLETRKQERDELIREKGRAEVVGNRDLHKEHGDEIAKISEIKGKIAASKHEDAKKKLTELTVQKAQLEKDLSGIKPKGHKKEVVRIEVCPAYNVKCPITQKQFDKIKEDIGITPSEDLSSKVDTINDKILSIGKEIEEQKGIIDSYNNLIDELKGSEAKLLEVKKYIDSGIKPIEEVNKSLAQADTLLKNCEKVYNSLKEYQKAVVHNNELEGRQGQVDNEIEVFDRLARLFSPEGNLLNASEKVKTVNDSLEGLKDFIKYPVQITESLEIEGIPVRMSRAEKYIVNIALLIALKPPFNPVVIDDADMFDSDCKEKLFTTFLKLKDYKFIVLAAQHNGSVKPSQFAGIKVFHVNGGVSPVLNGAS